MTRLVFLILLGVTFSLLSTNSLASAEIKVSPPTHWQANPTNNSTAMVWFENSTESILAIYKVPDNLAFPLIFVAPFMSQFLTNQGVLESEDQVSFGQNNYGYRYFLNLSSPSKLLNSSSGLLPEGGVFGKIPKETDVPYKGMLVITEKQGDLYAILFGSPRENFDSLLNEIKPTIDSIQLSNSTPTN
jgi:hypothetical protein